MTLEPDAQLSDEVVIAFDSDREAFVLSEAGQYEFQVIYRDVPQDPNAVPESSILTIEAQAPPASERAALRSYSKELALVAQANHRWSGVSDEAVERAMSFIDSFPSSPYARHVRDGLMWALEERVVRNRASAGQRTLYERLKAQRP